MKPVAVERARRVAFDDLTWWEIAFAVYVVVATDGPTRPTYHPRPASERRSGNS
jgi:hypothetical protein